MVGVAAFFWGWISWGWRAKSDRVVFCVQLGFSNTVVVDLLGGRTVFFRFVVKGHLTEIFYGCNILGRIDGQIVGFGCLLCVHGRIRRRFGQTLHVLKLVSNLAESFCLVLQCCRESFHNLQSLLHRLLHAFYLCGCVSVMFQRRHPFRYWW